MKPQKRRAIDKIRFSIGTKLITIITIILLLSLGTITALVSWLIREDLKFAAEEKNTETNERSATEAEEALRNIRSGSLLLMQTINVIGAESARSQETVNFFFEHNPQIAAFIYMLPGREEKFFANSGYFAKQNIEPELAASYYEHNRAALRRTLTGETVLLNVAPWFSRPLLAMFFPWQNGGGSVLFSLEHLKKSFDSGINESYLINDRGAYLVHSDFSLLRSGADIADKSYFRQIQESPGRSRQMLIDTESENAIAVEPGFIQLAKDSFLSVWTGIKQNVKPVIHDAKMLVYKVVNKFVPDWMDEPKKSETDRFPEEDRNFYMAFTRLNADGCIVITSIGYDKALEGVTATTRRNIYLTAAVLFAAIVFIWFFSKTISIPLKALAFAARSIEGGQFEQEVRVPKSRDEIGALNHSFQRMSKALGIFGRFTNREIAIKAMRGEIKPGGLPKHATVFFSDIRGFTEKSEIFTREFGKEASDKIVFWLNEYLSQMVECVEKTGGAVDKFIGDAVMAHWGTAYTAGSPRKDAFNCVKAALLMRAALVKMNKNRKAWDIGNPAISIGCGINTGIVTAGQIGSDLRMEYTVIGDPVNLASRVEALNKPMGTDILISENTWRLVKDFVITEEMPSVTVKGKKKPVRVFAVINLRTAKNGPKTLTEVRKLMDINAPDVSKEDLDSDEKKYKITSAAGKDENAKEKG